MACYVKVFNLSEAAPEDRLEAQNYHSATQTYLHQHKHNHASGNTDHNKATERNCLTYNAPWEIFM